jgi:hypothetical protein
LHRIPHIPAHRAPIKNPPALSIRTHKSALKWALLALPIVTSMSSLAPIKGEKAPFCRLCVPRITRMVIRVGNRPKIKDKANRALVTLPRFFGTAYNWRAGASVHRCPSSTPMSFEGLLLLLHHLSPLRPLGPLLIDWAPFRICPPAKQVNMPMAREEDRYLV